MEDSWRTQAGEQPALHCPSTKGALPFMLDIPGGMKGTEGDDGMSRIDAEELLDIAIAVLVLGFVVSYNGLSDIPSLARSFVPNTAIIGLSFVAHELAHRQVARRLGFFARFELWGFGVLLSILMAVVGGIGFAAVGAVMIYPVADLWGRARPITMRDMFLISVAGPITNILISGMSLAAFLFIPSGTLLHMSYLNLWLAVFNLIPFPPLDGSKIFAYSWKVWILVFLPTFLAFSYISYIL